MRSLVAAVLAASLAQGASMTAEMVFNPSQLVLSGQDGMTVVTLGRCAGTWQTGAPALPVAVAQLVVPQGMKVTDVVADEVETETIAGEYDVYPVQPPQPLSDPNPPAFVGPNPAYYGLAAYPAKVVTFGHQGSMFGYSIASVFVAPVQYNGSDRSLVFHPRIRFTIELEPADLGYLRPGNRSPAARRRVEALIASVVLNPDDVPVFAP